MYGKAQLLSTFLETPLPAELRLYLADRSDSGRHGAKLVVRGPRFFSLGGRHRWPVHNSQHLSDPYTLTHFLHGLGFYGLLWLFLRKRSGVGSRLVVTTALESGWEVLENTKCIIEKYREDTLALGYFGDSILNSVSDIVACGVGFMAAAYLPEIGSVLLFAAVEILLVIWIRDSLMLNILMLIWPLDSVREWQLSAALVWIKRSRLQLTAEPNGHPLRNDILGLLGYRSGTSRSGVPLFPSILQQKQCDQPEQRS